MSQVVLQAREVTKQYGRGRTAVLAVDGVSLEVSPGEIVLIMGPSGSGKTTLLSLVGAMLKPTSGTITVQDVEISALDEGQLPELRLSTFGFIFQDFNLLSALTARENVEVVLHLAGQRGRAARERATALLTVLGLEGRLDHRPAELSGGEKQRVAIARALANDPPLLLADEPTANLDSKSSRELMRLLRSIAKEQQRSLIMVSHDQRLQEIADRVLWLEDGRFKELRAMVRDPICLMAIERERAPAHTEYKGVTYYFCARGCRDEFEEDPARFVRALEEFLISGKGAND